MGRQKVLIADDSPALAKLLAELLGDEYEILIAPDGEGAIAMANDQRPDLILLDVMMPGVDGFEVCRQLKAEERTQRIPLIFITGLNALDAEQRGLELGAIDFIAKPVQPATLRLRIKNHLELKRYRDFLEDMSLIDGLTGIGNRRCLDEFLFREWRRARRKHTPLSLLLLDVDFFKPYNDHYGHTQGDDCLRQVATAIQGLVHRPADLAARYGGEEFAIVLPDTEPAGAYIMAERVRAAVMGRGIAHETSLVAPVITVSVGVAAYDPAVDLAPDDLLRRADQKLYAAKRAGRNRVM